MQRKISAQSYGKYGKGLASEGYLGGYRDALDDVMLALNGVHPTTRYLWDDYDE